MLYRLKQNLHQEDDMSQLSFSDEEYSRRKRITKREEFLKTMNDIIPWAEWVDKSLLFYQKSGNRATLFCVAQFVFVLFLSAIGPFDILFCYITRNISIIKSPSAQEL